MYELTHDAIDVDRVRTALQEPSHGATLLFFGIARDHFEGRGVKQLEYQAYPEMTLPALEAIGREASVRWPGSQTVIIHRLGVVPQSALAVVIGTSTAHRADCYEANRFAIEELKRTVPIWKKEIYVDGSEWKANKS